MIKEVLQQALEALEGLFGTTEQFEGGSVAVWRLGGSAQPKQAITAIREALAQPRQCQCPECQVLPHASDCAVHNEPAYSKGVCSCKAQPVQEPPSEWAVANAMGAKSVHNCEKEMNNG